MSNIRFIFFSAAAGLAIGLAVFFGRDAMQQLSDHLRRDSYYTGIMNASPAVVSLYSSETVYRLLPGEATSQPLSNTQPPQIPDRGRQTSQGSGVIISDNGYVLTNYHLIRSADDINVALTDGRLFKAAKIGADPETDLAIVKIDTTESLPSCGLEHNSEARVGDIVLAIGNPFGVGQTVTQGIVSATSRHISGTSQLQQFLQIDAAINPGNSGGALINTQGDLLGINTAVFSSDTGAEGIGFTIPTALIRQVVPEIIARGRVARGWLGIGVDNLHQHPDLYNLTSNGAVVSGVFENSPAHLSGLRRGDIITSINDIPIHSAGQVMRLVSSFKPHIVVNLKGQRQTQAIELSIPLAERPGFN